MATHSSVLAWKIPWTEECGGLQSMGSKIIRRDRACMHIDSIIDHLGYSVFFFFFLVMLEKSKFKIH